MSKIKDVDTQWMRCIAAFFVVLIHVVDLSSRTGIFFSAISRFSVPVFVLISGWYMLEKHRCVLELAKRSGFLLLQLVVWGCLQFTVELLIGLRTWNGLFDLVQTVLVGGGHFWYLYALIGLYLFTPILQVFSDHADQRTYSYALILLFVLGSPITIALRMERFALLTAVINNMKIPHILGFIFLYLMGDYLRRYPPQKTILWCFVGLVGIVTTVLWSLKLPPDRAADLSLSFFFPGNILGAVGFFVITKAFYTGGGQFMLTIASCTSGIYLSHMIILKCLQLWLWPSLLVFPSWLAYLLLAAAVYALSVLLTLFLRQFSFAHKLV